MRQSKTQIRLRNLRSKSYKSAYAPIEDSDQTAHLRSKSYKSAYAPIEDSDQTAHPRIKSYKSAYAPIKDSDQTTHPRSKSYKSVYAPIEDSDQTSHLPSKSYKSAYAPMKESDCTFAQQKFQVGICANRRLIRLRIRASKVNATSRPSANRRLGLDCVFVQQKLQVGICAHQRIRLRIRAAKVISQNMRQSQTDQTAHPHIKSYQSAYAPIEDLSDCATAHQKLPVGICANRRLIRLRIRTSKVTSQHMRQSKTDQTAHPLIKSYKSAYAPIEA